MMNVTEMLEQIEADWGGIVDANILLRDKLCEYENLLGNHRAGKLLRKGKSFITVAIDEPYFRHVYLVIRLHEMSKGTWTEQDEEIMSKQLAIWAELFPKNDEEDK